MPRHKTEARLSRTLNALSDPTRRAIVARLSEGTATAGELAEPFWIGRRAAEVRSNAATATRSGLTNHPPQPHALQTKKSKTMDRRFCLAVLGYLVPTFPLGYFWHLTVFADRYHELAMYREQVIIPMGLASMLIQAVLFAWAYPRLFGSFRDWKAGALGFGVFFGVLAWSFMVLPVAAKYRMTSVPDFLALESAFTFLHFLIVSPCVALAYRQVHIAQSTPPMRTATAK